MMRRKILSLFLLTGLLFTGNACRQTEEPSQRRTVSQETLLKANQYLAEKDDERIKRFIERHGWKMTRSPRGYWYEIWHHGDGPRVSEGKEVVLEYTLRLLDGSKCYTSAEKGPLTFTVGHGQVVAGLDQAVRLLRQGDKARIILPPFLAYGVPGDRDKVPPRSVIVYELQVKEVK